MLIYGFVNIWHKRTLFIQQRRDGDELNWISVNCLCVWPKNKTTSAEIEKQFLNCFFFEIWIMLAFSVCICWVSWNRWSLVQRHFVNCFYKLANGILTRRRTAHLEKCTHNVPTFTCFLSIYDGYPCQTMAKKTKKFVHLTTLKMNGNATEINYYICK